MVSQSMETFPLTASILLPLLPSLMSLTAGTLQCPDGADTVDPIKLDHDTDHLSPGRKDAAPRHAHHNTSYSTLIYLLTWIFIQMTHIVLTKLEMTLLMRAHLHCPECGQKFPGLHHRPLPPPVIRPRGSHTKHEV